MNAKFGKSSNFDFDLGLSSNRSRSLNDQKHQSYSSSSSPSSYASSTTQSRPGTTSSWQPNKPSWTHQPAPGHASRPGASSSPVSMVGDILGKSWNSAAPAPSSSPAASIGMPNKNPNLFGDLVNLGQGKSNSNVPLKGAAPVSSKSSYSMGNMADSLPKAGNSMKNSGNWGSSGSSGGYTSSMNNSNKRNNGNASKSVNHGASMRSMGGSGGGMSTSKDPFVSLVDFGSKEGGGSLNTGKNSNKVNKGDDNTFGNFQTSTPSYPTSANSASSNINVDFMGSSSTSSSNIDDFGIPAPAKDFTSKQQSAEAAAAGGDPFDMFVNSSSSSAGPAPSAAQGPGNQQFSELDDWGADSGFGGGKDEPTTTELEGLPPPPAGVSASAAMSKGVENKNQGQFADAIKWLSWAVILSEKSGDASAEVLSCRASCYKEVGEYKKAVADCTKVLESDGENVAVLVQRALLYESMEKYKLGAEDLRTVMKLDPVNRVARSTIHRMNKMAE